MSIKHAPELAPRMQKAIAELQALVTEHYPEATFQVTRNPEDGDIVLLKPVVNVDDRDEVMDLIIDRLVELQSEEQLPLLVVPIRPKARNEAVRRAMRQSAPHWRKRLPPIQR